MYAYEMLGMQLLVLISIGITALTAILIILIQQHIIGFQAYEANHLF